MSEDKNEARAAGPDATIRCADGSSCGLWWSSVPSVAGERVGCIGNFHAPDPASPLVREAVERLRQEGVSLVLAPMDGTTWHSYRFVTGGDEEPPFFLEPANPAFYPSLLREAGFGELARYSSSVVPLEEARPLVRVEARLARAGVVIRNLRPAEMGAELDRLHELSLAAFADNFLYTPIGREAFRALYAGVEPLLAPGFVRFAEADGRPVAFVFAYPDVLEGRRTGRTTTVVVKTLATHPGWRHLGIGSVLVEQVQARARELGFTRAIHALQHERNTSLRITRRNQGHRLREYALFSRSLR